MIAPYCIVSLLISMLVGASQDFIDCFTSLRNVRVTCVEAIEQRTTSSLTQCQELCLTNPAQCKTAQFDLNKNLCEIFTTPSLLSSHPEKTKRRHYRQVSTFSNKQEKCAPALQPSIGSLYLVPRRECFVETKQAGYAQNVNVLPVQGRIFGEESEQDQLTLEEKPPHDPFSAIPVEVLPIVPDCPIGEKARVQVIDGVEARVISTTSVTFKVETPEKCVHACMTSSYPDASRLPLLCRSAQYNRQTSKCSVYPDALNPNGYLEYKPNTSVLYMEKVCISNAVLPLSCDEIFRRIPQHILLGHASEIVTSTSEEECIRECILAKVKHNIDCRSLLHYSDTPVYNCILNIHTRLTRPEYFVSEMEDKVDYVQIPECARNPTGDDQDSSNSKTKGILMSVDTRVIDSDKNVGLSNGVGSVESEWSAWTNCDQRTSTRRRERVCSDCVEHIQVQPCFSNENFNNVLNTFISEQEVSQPRNQLIKTSTKKPPTKVLPFPLSTLSSNNNQTAGLEFFGPPFQSLSPTWLSSFRRI